MARLKNQRAERFAQNIIKGLNATQAYINAGYSDKGAKSAAHRKLQEPEIQARIRELNDEIINTQLVADANEMQRFLTDVIRGRESETLLHEGSKWDVPPQIKERIAAVNTLARMQGVLNPRGDDNDDGQLDAITAAINLARESLNKNKTE